MNTRGICCSIQDQPNQRFFLFELDGAMSEIHEDVETIICLYIKNKLEFLMHRTGKGFHFISPTLISKEKWKEMMQKVHYLNKKCPMTTLRWIPNKYPNERDIWFISKQYYFPPAEQFNSIEMCNLLNHSFEVDFKGSINAAPKQVIYPLPDE